jgi:hypothetical protein
MTLSNRLLFCGAALLVISLVPSCEDTAPDEPKPDVTAGGASGLGGDDSSEKTGGGGNAVAGIGATTGGAAGHGVSTGDVAGQGAGGSAECLVADCEDLNESDCLSHSVNCEMLDGSCLAGTRGAAAGCEARYGVASAAEPGADKQYAGCATVCCGAECPGVKATDVCALDKEAACWTLSSAPIPDGWTLLSDVEPCASIAECTD